MRTASSSPSRWTSWPVPCEATRRSGRRDQRGNCSSSSPLTRAGSVSTWPSCMRGRIAASVEADRDDRVRDRAAVDDDLVAGALAEQLPPQLGVVGDAVLEDVGLVRAHEVEDLPLALLVLELEARAEGRGRVVSLPLDDDGAVDDLLEVGDARLVRALQQPRLVVGGALAQVAVGQGSAHVVGELLPLLLLEVAQLFLDLLETLGGQVDGFLGHVTPLRPPWSRPRETRPRMIHPRPVRPRCRAHGGSGRVGVLTGGPTGPPRHVRGTRGDGRARLAPVRYVR